MNYFSLFNLPERFKINSLKLTKNFYYLQKKFHPDLFMNSSPKIQLKKLNRSIEINKGYKTLKNPLKRAKYLLALNNVYSLSKKYKKKYSFFLKKQFNLYEKLDQLIKKKYNKDKLTALFFKIKKNEYNDKKNLYYHLDNKNWNIGMFYIHRIKFFCVFKSYLKKNKKAF